MPKSGTCAGLLEKRSMALFSGHGLRAGLAGSTGVDERQVQEQLGRASAKMTRRFGHLTVSLTKANGWQGTCQKHARKQHQPSVRSL